MDMVSATVLLFSVCSAINKSKTDSVWITELIAVITLIADQFSFPHLILNSMLHVVACCSSLFDWVMLS